VAEALADELDTDEFAAKFTKSFFFNRARPDLVIFRKDLDREEAKRLERDFVDNLVIFRKDLDREEAKRLERDFVDKNRGF